jgi:hypothetical protein
MSGLEMMLRSFGMDPEEIKKSMSGTVEAIKTFDGRLLAIEGALNRLNASIDRMEAKLDGREFAGPSNYEPGAAYCVGCGRAVGECACGSAARANGTIIA